MGDHMFQFLHNLANIYLLFSFLIITILTDVKCYSLWFWFTIPWWLVNIFSYSLTFCIFPLEKCLFRFLTHFKLGLLNFQLVISLGNIRLLAYYFNWGFVAVGIELLRAPYLFWKLTPNQTPGLQAFCPIP